VPLAAIFVFGIANEAQYARIGEAGCGPSPFGVDVHQLSAEGSRRDLAIPDNIGARPASGATP
jgi:hypothetical protein